MSNKVQLAIQLAGLALATITMILSVTTPIYTRLEAMGIRLTVMETQLQHIKGQTDKPRSNP